MPETKQSSPTLTDAVREMHELTEALKAHREQAQKRDAELASQIAARRRVLELSADGIDQDKIDLAKTVIFVSGQYSRAGSERASVLNDAVKQIATGIPSREFYGDLWHVALGTKDYDRWSGQRCDCEYGYGPRHGSIVFQVGLKPEVRKVRKHADLTPAEIEAAVYYLTNLERVQAAEARASLSEAR